MPGGLAVAYATVIFFSAAVGGGLPLFIHNKWRSHTLDKGIQLGTIFGGGIFIAAGFVHLLGDAAKDLNTGDGYPLAELWCAIDVLIPLLIDSFASLFAARVRFVAQLHSHAHGGHSSHGHVELPENGHHSEHSHHSRQHDHGHDEHAHGTQERPARLAHVKRLGRPAAPMWMLGTWCCTGQRRKL